jgi:hypothetical protein
MFQHAGIEAVLRRWRDGAEASLFCDDGFSPSSLFDLGTVARKHFDEHTVYFRTGQVHFRTPRVQFRIMRS